MTDELVDEGSLAPQEPRPARRGRRRIVSALIAGGLAIGVALLVFNLLSGSLFFYNADEAVERRAELGDERFTLQGAPVGCSIVNGFQGDDSVVAFSVTFGGESVDIVHFGDPAELFREEVAVVLDGNWVEGDHGVDGFNGLAEDGYYFASDNMRVKHDNDYINEEGYDERLAETEEQSADVAEACA